MADTPVSQASILGTTFGHYEVLALIGRGAMGTVYLARDVRLQRLVALKVLLGSVARNPSAVKTFHREAQAAAPLKHPGIVRIYAAGMLNGTPFIAMEYIEGEPLDRFLRRNGIIKWQQALYIGGQVAQALSCAHAAGIVHRDVKPGNMLLDSQGQVRLTDFGIANIQSEGDAFEEMGFVGTPHYMAPEQCGRGEVTPRSDLFALGVILYQMISGTLPFEADSGVALMKKISSDEPARLNRVFSDVPDDVARLVARLLQKDPMARPASAIEVAETIDRLQRSQGGRSAIPEALNAFIREQSEIKPLRADYSSSIRKRSPAEQTAAKKEAAGSTVIPRVVRAALGACAACGLVIAIWFGARERLTKAPDLDWFRVDRSARSELTATLPNESLTLTSITWLKNGTRFIVRADGMPGTLFAGSSGSMIVDMRDETALSLGSPVLQSAVPDFASRMLDCQSISGDHWIAVSIESRTANAKESRVMAWSGYSTESIRHSLFAVASKSMESDSLAPGMANPAFSATLSANGSMVCAIVDDAAVNGVRIDCWRIADNRIDGVPVTLTSSGSAIVPDSLRFGPADATCAYARYTESGACDLWVLNADTDESDGRLLASNVILKSYVFGPDGSRIALLSEHPTTHDQVIRIVRVADAYVETELPADGLVPASWHPKGSHLYCGRISGDTSEIIVVETLAPNTRQRIARLGGEITCGPAISPDGSEVAVGYTRRGYPAVTVFPISADAAKQGEPYKVATAPGAKNAMLGRQP
jgi:serine/threonine protein kinase